MNGLRGLLVLVVTAGSVGCYSHTKEVIVERPAAPAGCNHAAWVPPAGGAPGYWRCSL
jgi:hypothetical protein